MRRLVVLFALALVLPGCPDSFSPSTDTPIVFDLDGAMFDGGVDAPAPDLVIGDACTSTGDCGEGGLCLNDPDLAPGGYCSQSCAGGAACPEGSTCLDFGMGQSFCFLDCDPEASTRPCEREGYGCATNFMFIPEPVCLPGCFDASDCPAGAECDPTGGFIGAGACFEPGAMPGDACTSDTDCPSGGACITEADSGWPSGTCAVGCDAATGDGCDGGTCIPGNFGDFCVASCTSSSDCRPGYRCEANDAPSGGSYCAPGCATDDDCATSGYVCNPGLGTCDVPFDAALLGETCNRRTGGCEGGSCLSESSSGFPGAYCSYAGCTLGGTDCPGDGVCVAGAGDTNFCFDGCTADADCRTGYACRPSDYTVTGSPLVCSPACTATSQCANAMRGFECNVGTGRCTTPFDAALQGEPCADTSECPGGRCRDEATDGWPAGTCAALGCRLAGTGASVDCGAGAVCVDDALGDPDVGECLTACTVGTSGCRPGYACVALASGGTEGACRPACDATSCGTGRTCDTASGLCR
jgi:hypothetical protein